MFFLWIRGTIIPLISLDRVGKLADKCASGVLKPFPGIPCCTPQMEMSKGPINNASFPVPARSLYELGHVSPH